MNPNDIRRWVEDHRAAAAREAAERRNRPLPPATSLQYALDLLLLDESQNGDPFNRHDPVTEREDEQMWENWAKLRARWGDGR